MIYISIQLTEERGRFLCVCITIVFTIATQGGSSWPHGSEPPVVNHHVEVMGGQQTFLASVIRNWHHFTGGLVVVTWSWGVLTWIFTTGLTLKDCTSPSKMGKRIFDEKSFINMVREKNRIWNRIRGSSLVKHTAQENDWTETHENCK